MYSKNFLSVFYFNSSPKVNEILPETTIFQVSGSVTRQW